MSRLLEEDEVRDGYSDAKTGSFVPGARQILGFDDGEAGVKQGTGQIYTFNKLGFPGVNKKPDGWYFPDDKSKPAIILETKNSGEDLTLVKWEDELLKNVDIAKSQYKEVVGILYNGNDVRVFMDHEEIHGIADRLQNKEYYLKLFTSKPVDKKLIYKLTKQINNSLHFNFGIKNLYHRMIFTACALVAVKEGAPLFPGMDYNTLHTCIMSQINKSLSKAPVRNAKLSLLSEVYADIKMNQTDNQEAIDDFIDCVKQISDNINSDNWNGEDVMGIFFNEFNRYKPKSESGQVFTPEHITSFMYRLIDVKATDRVGDFALGSGGFVVKAMCNMIKEVGGINTKEAKNIMSNQLYGIEYDKEIYALACANMLIHKDGKTNLEQLDTRSQEACDWIKSKNITKVLMNPPFENGNGCTRIVKNVLDSVPVGTICAFILPDRKLETAKGKGVGKTKKGNYVNASGKVIIKNHRLLKIVKLPEKLFDAGVTTSIFIFEAGVPQNGKEIFACYMEDDGLERVKNQGRQDVHGRWQAIEDYWVDAIYKQKETKYGTGQWLNPAEHLSYQLPEKPFEISEEDFMKTTIDYLLFKNGIDAIDFKSRLSNKILYSAEIAGNDDKITISFERGDTRDED